MKVEGLPPIIEEDSGRRMDASHLAAGLKREGPIGDLRHATDDDQTILFVLKYIDSLRRREIFENFDGYPGGLARRPPDLLLGLVQIL
jgi:hypothetical protein